MLDDDPRHDSEFVRRLTDVVLVGVVHDHPASVHRVQAAVASVDPDVLALELSPAAVGLFEAYAEGPRTPPEFGGEMSAAVQAAETDRVVGVDGPSTRFVWRLARTLYREGASRSTVRGALRRLAASTRRTALCRIGAAVASHTPFRVEVDAPVDHEVSRLDDPEEQAADERSRVRKAEAIASAFEPPRASRVCDSVREAHMADRIDALREEGDVVAVVGIGHLDALVDRLD